MSNGNPMDDDEALGRLAQIDSRTANAILRQRKERKVIAAREDVLAKVRAWCLDGYSRPARDALVLATAALIKVETE